MTFFHPTEPIFRAKQEELDVQDLCGLLRLELKLGDRSLFPQRFYTRIDQVFLLWGVATAAIFATAQFLPVSWHHQAVAWTGLTALAVFGTARLSWYWVSVEYLRWLVAYWGVLMLGGALLTSAAVFQGWGLVLMNLCPLWLFLCTLGYLGTGWGLRSRSFLLAALIHLFAIVPTWHYLGWQFLITGAVMSVTLLIFAEVQWDMRPPIDSDRLSPEQLAFNRLQAQQRARVS